MVHYLVLFLHTLGQYIAPGQGCIKAKGEGGELGVFKKKKGGSCKQRQGEWKTMLKNSLVNNFKGGQD